MKELKIKVEKKTEMLKEEFGGGSETFYKVEILVRKERDSSNCWTVAHVGIVNEGCYNLLKQIEGIYQISDRKDLEVEKYENMGLPKEIVEHLVAIKKPN